jgi:hypothetical protein
MTPFGGTDFALSDIDSEPKTEPDSNGGRCGAPIRGAGEERSAQVLDSRRPAWEADGSPTRRDGADDLLPGNNAWDLFDMLDLELFELRAVMRSGEACAGRSARDGDVTGGRFQWL